MSKLEDSTRDQANRTAKPRVLKDRLQAHFREYGKLAFGIYFSLSIMTLVGFYIAIKSGVDVGSKSGKAGALVAAWVAAKLTMPIRIGTTLALTPILARVVRRKPKETPPVQKNLS